MRNSYLAFLIAAALMGMTREVAAQAYSAAGYTINCRDVNGVAVRTVFHGAAASQTAIATVVQGWPTIVIDPQQFNQMTPAMRLFTFAHECAHHMVGHVIGVLTGNIDLARERVADKIAIRYLRDNGGISQATAQSIASAMSSGNGGWPFYLPGPERAKWVMDCYKTQSNDCRQDEGDAESANCSEKYNACISEIQGVQQCVQDRFPAQCIETCTEKFGHPYQICKWQLCQPTQRNIGSWSDLCEDYAKIDKDACREMREICLMVNRN